MTKKPITKEKAQERLEILCSRSEQCEFDLNRKMIVWGISSQQRKEILNSLKENRYLDDSRFARSFANDKARFSSWGPYKIRMELIKRKIGAATIKESLERVESEVWREGLLRSARSKSKNLDLLGDNSYENGKKLFQYLIGRGFPSKASSQAVSIIKKEKSQENS